MLSYTGRGWSWFPFVSVVADCVLGFTVVVVYTVISVSVRGARRQPATDNEPNNIDVVLPGSGNQQLREPARCSRLNAADVIVITYITLNLIPQFVLFGALLRRKNILVVRACRFCFVIGYICDSVVYIFRRDGTLRAARRFVRVWRQRRELRNELQNRVAVAPAS